MLTLLQVIKAADSAMMTVPIAQKGVAHAAVGEGGPNKVMPWAAGRKPALRQPNELKRVDGANKAANYNNLGSSDMVTGNAKNYFNNMVQSGINAGPGAAPGFGWVGRMSEAAESLKPKKKPDDRWFYQRFWDGFTNPYDAAEEYSNMGAGGRAVTALRNATGIATNATPIGWGTSLAADAAMSQLPETGGDHSGAWEHFGALVNPAHYLTGARAQLNNMTGRLDTSGLPNYGNWRGQNTVVDMRRRDTYNKMKSNPAYAERAKALFPEYAK